jgi:hypothetical protein
MVDDLLALDQVQAREALAQLARLRVAHVNAPADRHVVRCSAEQRRLHLAGALLRVEAQAAREVRPRQA